MTSKSEIVLPPVKHNIISIPGRDGGLISETRLEMRKIDVNIEIDIPVGWTLEDVEEDLADYLFSEKEEELIFTTATDRTYYARIENTSLELIGQLAAVGRLSFICPDPYKYGPLREIKLDAQTNKIYYAGTAPVIPEVEIIPKEKTTYVGYINNDKSVIVGAPTEVDSVTYNPEPLVFDDVMSNINNWQTNTNMHGVQVSGGFSTSSELGLWPIDYGAGTEWHGPSIIRTLNEPLDDFLLWVSLRFDNSSVQKMGKLEWHLLSADDEIQARITFGDFSPSFKRSMAQFYIGNPVNNKRYRLSDDKWTLKFHGVVQIRKVGNVIELYTARTDPRPHYQIQKRTIVDTDGLFSKPIAKIKLAICQYADYPTADPRVSEIALRKINPPKEELIPYIADAGDSVVIDKALNVYKNGESGLGINPFSKPIQLQKGENNLTVLPPNADVTVRFREVFK